MRFCASVVNINVDFPGATSKRVFFSKCVNINAFMVSRCHSHVFCTSILSMLTFRHHKCVFCASVSSTLTFPVRGAISQYCASGLSMFTFPGAGCHFTICVLCKCFINVEFPGARCHISLNVQALG